MVEPEQEIGVATGVVDGTESLPIGGEAAIEAVFGDAADGVLEGRASPVLDR